MSAKALILIASIVAYIAINNHFLRTDDEFREQTENRALFGDPLGIQRFKQQPKKMIILTAVLLGPILSYYLFFSQTAG